MPLHPTGVNRAPPIPTHLKTMISLPASASPPPCSVHSHNGAYSEMVHTQSRAAQPDPAVAARASLSGVMCPPPHQGPQVAALGGMGAGGTPDTATLRSCSVQCISVWLWLTSAFQRQGRQSCNRDCIQSAARQTNMDYVSFYKSKQSGAIFSIIIFLPVSKWEGRHHVPISDSII